MIEHLEERAEKALNYLAETDRPHAEAKARMNRLAEVRKMVLAMGFDFATGAAEARRQAAHNTDQYRDHIELQNEADIAFHTMDNHRRTAVTIIDLYRTVSANQRRG